jgi:HK97 family phage prohead protease
MAKRINKRADDKSLEIRSIGEIRETTDEGIVEAYLTAWGTVDSYKSTFKRGSFKKTFGERADKIRLLWNHEALAGKIIEAREDDYGPFVRCQFNLDTRSGKESFAHVKGGDVDSFSFGFNVVNDKIVNGVREISEVRCMECGPVIFEANGAAKIVDVRAEDFDETVKERDLRERGWKLRYSLSETLDDIMWANNSADDILSKSDAAIASFHGHYLDWLREVTGAVNADSIRSISSVNDLSFQVRSKLDADVTKTTSLTEGDIKLLRSGKLLVKESRSKLAELPEEIREAHQTERRKAVDTLCDEFRSGGFSDAEKMRFSTLLGITQEPDEIGKSIDFMKNFRSNLR